MRILFWVQYPTEGASNRYRVEQYLPYIEEKNIKYTLHPFWSRSAFKILYNKGEYLKKIFYFLLGTAYRIIDLITINRYDVVFIHREAYPIGGAIFEKIISAFKKPIIFDFDDAIYLPYRSLPNSFIEKYKKFEKIVEIISISKYVIAGNRYLLDFALQYNSSCSIIPTSVDTNKFYPIETKHRNEIVVGWMGTTTTVEYLNILINPVIRISKQFPFIKFKIVGGHFSINGLSNITCKPWSLEEEMADLRSFDIGISPLPDNKWTIGKCGFKALLFMSMGVPCVCSPVGINREIIIDGVNGFFADSDEEWIEKILRLTEEPALRKKIGLAGRNTVKEKYSVDINSHKFLEILEKVYNSETC